MNRKNRPVSRIVIGDSDPLEHLFYDEWIHHIEPRRADRNDDKSPIKGTLAVLGIFGLSWFAVGTAVYVIYKVVRAIL